MALKKKKKNPRRRISKYAGNRCERKAEGYPPTECQGLIGNDGVCFSCKRRPKPKDISVYQEEEEPCYVDKWGDKHYMSGGTVVPSFHGNYGHVDVNSGFQGGPLDEEVYGDIDWLKAELGFQKAAIANLKKIVTDSVLVISNLKSVISAQQVDSNKLLRSAKSVVKKIEGYGDAAEYVNEIKEKLKEIEERTKWMVKPETGKPDPVFEGPDTTHLLTRFRNLEIE